MAYCLRFFTDWTISSQKHFILLLSTLIVQNTIRSLGVSTTPKLKCLQVNKLHGY